MLRVGCKHMRTCLILAFLLLWAPAKADKLPDGAGAGCTGYSRRAGVGAVRPICDALWITQLCWLCLRAAPAVPSRKHWGIRIKPGESVE